MEGNIYKPRYKIAFLSKSKVWIYKESRLRRFFNIRGRKLVRRGLFKRYILVFNNMKWTVARRYIRPFMRGRRTPKRRYKTAFYNKQQLRHFYGKFKEEAFRNLFRAHLVGVYKRNKSFYSNLERRVDMFLFRARHLPTFYAANQFVHHQGVEHNGVLDKSPNSLIGPGTSLLFEPYFWELFSDHLYDRIDMRFYGQELLKKRVYVKLKKKVKTLLQRRKRISRKQVLYFQLLRKVQGISGILRRVLQFFVTKKITKKLAGLQTASFNSASSYRRLPIFAEAREQRDLRKHIEVLVREVRNIEKEHTTLLKTSFNITRKLLKQRLRRKIKNFKLRAKQRRKVRRKHRKLKRLKSRFIWRKVKNIKYKLERPNVRKVHSAELLNIAKFKYKVRKQKVVQVYVLKLLKSFFGLYARVVNLFALDKEYTYSENYKVLTQYLKIASAEFTQNEKAYLCAIELKRQNKNNVTQKLFEEANLTYENHKFELKSIVSLYTKETLREKNLNARLALIKEKLGQLTQFFIESFRTKRIYKRWRPQNRIKTSKGMLERTEEAQLRRNAIYYFFMGRRLKRRKRRTVPRLKMVHWYVPSYMYFDPTTMESMMLHDPLPSEIHHSFKCSLPKLHAFYRSRGL